MDRRKKVEDCCPVSSIVFNSIFRSTLYYFNFWPTVYEVVRVDSLRLLLGLHQGPSQAQLHVHRRWKAGLQNPVVSVQRYNCYMSNRKTPLATTAFYFISFACLYGNIILSRLHRLRTVRQLVRLCCKKVRITREA